MNSGSFPPGAGLFCGSPGIHRRGGHENSRCFRARTSVSVRAQWLAFLIGALGTLGSTAATSKSQTESSNVSAALVFERDIRPILKLHCFQCHGENGLTKGGLDLRLRRLMLTNVEAGPVLSPGKPEESVLMHLMASGEMPKEGKPVSPDELNRVREWIRQGAATQRPEPSELPAIFLTEEERAFWSFQPIRLPPVPLVQHAKSVRTPVDAFLLARLETNHLHFALPSDRALLLRRVTWDLTGLPPTPEEVDAFVQDRSPDAFEKVVDRLLASERYGERWGRFWLDVAGYADSNGGAEVDSERPWAWRYRDYVIRAFNADKPFNDFLTEQLAGDELVAPPYEALSPSDLDKLIATGFLRLAPDPTGDGPPDPDLSRNQVIADTLQIVSSSLLGLTVQCAQCHDHRYDPIPQSDYYRLRTVFEPAFDWKQWRNPADRLVSLMSREDRALAECVEHAAKAVDAEAQGLHDSLIEKFVQKQLELVPEADRGPVMAARQTPAAKRTEDHKRLLREYPTFQDHILLGEINPDGAKTVEAVRKRAGEIRGAKPADLKVHCLVEEPGKKPDTFVFYRGDHLQPQARVDAGGLTVLAEVAPWETTSASDCLKPVRGTSGRRLALARYLTSGSHPLTARVWVNRVWHHHFGTGLVSTTGDFGALGERPSHPELLDWLASKFMAGGWKVKSLHRLILLSTAYQQGSRHSIAATRDPDNRLLGRTRLRRLDAESLRDSLLAISGRFNFTMYGPAVPVAVTPQGQFVVGAQNKDGNGDPTGVAGLGGGEFRRSVYVQVRRSTPVGIIETFDAPALTPNCEARPVSTVPTQSLMMMNDQFLLDTALETAARLRREHPGDLRGQLDRLWRLDFAQAPTPEEVQRSLTYVAEQTETLRSRLTAIRAESDKKEAPAASADASLHALASLCQSLWASNRFLYLE